MIDPSIPQHLQDLIKSELEIGERVAWCEMPIRSFFTPQAIASCLFGIPWTAFAVFWTVAAGIGSISIKDGLSLFSLFPLFGIPFIVIGIGMLTAPLFAYLKSRKTVYVITDKRAITFEGGRSTVIRNYPPEKLQDIYRNQKPDGSGDVVINVKEWSDSDGDKQTEQLGLLRVREAREVEKKLKLLAAKASPRTMEAARIPNESDSRIYPDLIN